MRVSWSPLRAALLALVATVVLTKTCGALSWGKKAAEEDTGPPLFCVVIRTYEGHGTDENGGIFKLLEVLQAQRHTRWEARLLIMDRKPFPELHYHLKDLNDERIQVFAEWVGDDYTPKKNGVWEPEYHTKLYGLTDFVIRACNPETKYVMVTNGDNLYATSLFEHVAAIDADAIALDYYSRYQRPTATPCERFQAGEGLPNCKRNEMKWCKVDLGSYILSWPRLIKEDLRFEKMDTSNGGIGHDGIMAQVVVQNGWKVHHITDVCLYEHSPSPQRCAREGGVWDDSWAGTKQKTAGVCVTHEQAHKLMKKPENEMITITVSTGNESIWEWGGSETKDPTQLLCIRVKDDRESMMAFFGKHCADDVDVDAFKEIKNPRTLELQGHQSDLPPVPKPATNTGPKYRKRYYPQGKSEL